MYKILKISILSILCLALVGIMIAFITGDVNFVNYKPKLVYENTFDETRVNTIKTDGRSMDVNIRNSENDQIEIKVYAKNDKKVKVSLEDGILIIDEKNRFNGCIGFCFESNRIDIYVPKNYGGNFDFTLTSGDVKSTIETYNDYKIKATSGDIILDKVASLTGKATSGDLQIESMNSKIDFTCTSGDIEIGKMTLTSDSSLKITSGDIKIDSVNNAYVNAKATSGDIKIGDNDRHADYEIKIEATSGDIRVN